MDYLSSLLQLAQRLLSLAMALFGIGFLIGFHEFGHFIFCKLFGIRTPTFSIGFGPKLFSRTIDGTEFTLSAIPLGGFVEIAGAAEVGQGDQEHAQSQESDSFAVKPYYQKFLVMTGGIMCNLLFAYVAFIGLSFIGIPPTPLMGPVKKSTVINFVEPNSAADRAKLLKGDEILSINSVAVQKNSPLLIETISQLASQTVPMSYIRENQQITTVVTVGSREISGQSIGSLGVAFDLSLPRQGFIGSIWQGIEITNQWICETMRGFGSIFKKADLKNVGGPVVIISTLTQGATSSIKIFIILLALISINLAILNLIPLPILDGGQLLFYTIEAIIGRPLPLKVREYIHIASWLAILALVLYLTVFDISRIASPYIENVKQFMGFGR